MTISSFLDLINNMFLWFKKKVQSVIADLKGILQKSKITGDLYNSLYRVSFIDFKIFFSLAFPFTYKVHLLAQLNLLNNTINKTAENAIKKNTAKTTGMQKKGGNEMKLKQQNWTETKWNNFFCFYWEVHREGTLFIQNWRKFHSCGAEKDLSQVVAKLVSGNGRSTWWQVVSYGRKWFFQ